jgi:uncharacterized iron-regulated membrane protein
LISPRTIFIHLHRWCGLVTAGFLFVAGLTGALISWDHELDSWLNPELFTVKAHGTPKPALELAALAEAADPRIWATFVYLDVPADEAYEVYIFPKVDPATGQSYVVDYNQVFMDPVSGEILGRRLWGVPEFTRANLMPFLYKLHYSLHIPDPWGLWLMGAIACIWAIDCFVGLYLTLPIRKRPDPKRSLSVARSLARGWWARWKPAWVVKWQGSPYRINFDLHRALSLWFWLVLFTLAISSASMNLETEVAKPLVNLFSTFTPPPYDTRAANPFNKPITAKFTYPEIIAKATAEGRAKGWDTPPGALYYAPHYGTYAIYFFNPGEEHGTTGGVGPAMLYYDGVTGKEIGSSAPFEGSAGDIFLQVQLPLHSGRIAGLPGRILISASGLIVALLCVTGVVIWWKKRRARVKMRAMRG